MIYQADAVLKSCVELMIEDMRANPWLLDDIFSNFSTNVYLKKKFATQIQNAKDWFAKNTIHIELGYVNDRAELPRISIVLGPQNQDTTMSTMADASVESVRLLPNQIDKPIKFIVKPFTPVDYDQSTGAMEVPATLKGFNKIVAGQILVNTSNGNGFPIQDVLLDSIIMLEADVAIGTGTFAVVPKFAYYEAKVEHIWQNANYQIICTGGSDAQQAIWLHDICFYGLLRYKEGLIEALGLYESTFDSGQLTQNPNLSDGAQVAWERTIAIKGKVEQSFIKAPHRLLESAEFIDTNPNNVCPAPDSSGWIGGIKIVTNLNSNSDHDPDPWQTVTCPEDDEA